MTDRLADLSARGVAVWLDDLSRDRLVSGGLDRLRREQHVVGVTSNPTIFAKAVAESKEYDWQLHDLAVRRVTVDEAARMITTYDIRWACDVMRPAFDASGGVDGRVSLEVDPRLAYQTDQTAAEVRALAWLVDRPNLFVKIPATEAGLPAITASLAAGISINVTLIFSLERYQQVMEAFLSGLERARDNGHDLSTIGSVASFFVSRVDTAIDAELERRIRETSSAEEAVHLRALRGRAAIANAKLAYRRFQQIFGGDRFAALRARGAHVQRPLWASTSTKNPDYRDVIYVEELIGPDTVNTMPLATVHAFGDHGVAHRTVDADLDRARNDLASLASVGIDLDDVTQQLQTEGVEKFAASFRSLLASVEEKLARVAKSA
jgi:transaldolase